MLFGPDGSTAFASTTDDVTALTLGLSGVYTLVLQAAYWQSGDIAYAFTASRTATGIATTPTGSGLAFGQTYTGTIDTAGQSDDYVFTIGSTTRVVFDSLSTDSHVTWSLVGPAGTIISPRSMSSADGYYRAPLPAILKLTAPGTYRLTMAGASGSGTGDYAFRLLDRAEAADVAIGNDIYGTLANSRETQIFTFDGAAGQSLFLDFASRTGNTIYVSIFDPSGRTVQSPRSLSGDFGPINLPATGSYTVLLEGYYNNPSAYSATFDFKLVAMPPVVAQALTIGDPVADSLANVAAKRVYTFSLADEASLYFDVLTAGNFYWTLDGPFGTEVDRRYFGSTDSTSNSDNPLLDLAAGDYRLTIESSGYDTGYAFNLIDLANGGPVTLGTPIDGTLASRETQVFKVDLEAGKSYRFGLSSFSTYGSYVGTRLIDPYGHQVFADNGYNFVETEPLVSGTYTFLLEASTGIGDADHAYTLEIAEIVAEPPAALTLDADTDVTFTASARTRTFAFSVAAATRAYFDSLTNLSGVVWSLTGPRGNDVIDRPFSQSDSQDFGQSPLIDLVAGDYTLTVTATDAAVSAARFRLLDLADVAEDLPDGAIVSGVLADGNRTDIYRFDGTAGESVYFDSYGISAGTITVRAISPSGKQVLSPTVFGDQGPLTLPIDGTYYVLVEGRISNSTADRSYTMAVHHLPQTETAIDPYDPGLAVGPLESDGVIGKARAFTGFDWISVDSGDGVVQTGDLTVEMWVNPDRYADSWMPLIYSGTGNSNARSYSLWLRSDGALWWGTRDASGERSITTSGGLVPLKTWTHIAAVIDRTNGEIRLVINGEEVATESVGAGPAISNDDPLLIGNTSEISTSYRSFEGLLDEVRIWSVARSDSDIRDTMDTVLAGNEAGLAFYLPLDDEQGAATFADLGPHGRTATPVSTIPADLGAIVGRLDRPGGTHSYTFTLAADAWLYLDTLTDDGGGSIVIRGPDGLEVNRDLRNANSYEFGSGDPTFRAPAGDYTLTVDGDDDRVLSYAFRLIDLNAADTVDIADGATVAGTLRPYATSRAVRFDAEAGARLFVDLQGVDSGWAAWRLYDPYGNMVLRTTNAADIANQILGQSGIYTLLFEPRVAVETLTELPYSFTIRTYDDSGAPLPIADNEPGPWRVAGRDGGQALALTGADYLRVPDSASLGLIGDMTMEGWFRVERFADTWTPLFYKSAGPNGTRSYTLWLRDNGSLSLDYADANGAGHSLPTAANVIPLGEWVHIAAVIDRTNQVLKIYVDGEEKASADISGTAGFASGGDLLIGHDEDTSTNHTYYEGELDDVRVWSSALTAAEIAAGMATRPDGSESDLVLDLRFEEADGDTAADASSSGNDATLVRLNTGGITGRIATAGEIDRYTFTLASDALIYFDSLTYNGSLSATLTGPRGQEFSRDLAHMDASQVSGSPVLALPAGTYTLAIAGSGDTTDFYNLRLVDLADATPLTLGDTVDGTLQPGKETDFYSFDASAGEHLFFDRIAADGDMRWRLIDPLGGTVFGATGIGDIADVALTADGTYTLLIEGSPYQDPDSTYQFAVHPIVADISALAFDQPVTGNINVPGNVDVYTFTLTEPTAVLFDSLTNNGSIYWSLVGPDGNIVTDRRFDSSDSYDFTGNPLMTLAAGSYSIRVRGNGDTTSAYAFQLLKTATAAHEVSFGATIGGTLGENGRDTDIFTFTADARERIAFALGNASSTAPYWRLIGPSGDVLFQRETLRNKDPLTLLYAGTYTLLVEGRDNANTDANYNFAIDRVSQPAAVGGPLMQDFQGGSGMPFVLVNEAGPDASYIDEGANTFLRLASQTENNQRNAVLFSRVSEGRLDQLTVGFDFRMTPNSARSDWGEGIGFALLDADAYGDGGAGPAPTTEPNLANAFGIGFDIHDNGGADDNANHISLHFNGNKLAEFDDPGFALNNGLFNHARIVFARTDGGTLVSVYLTENGGTEALVVDSYFVGGLELGESRIAFSGQTSGSSLVADQDIDDVTIAPTAAAEDAAAITFGEEVSGTIAQAQAVDRYLLTVSEAKHVLFNSLANTSDVVWSLSGPGVSISGRRFDQSDTDVQGANALIDLSTGTYVLSVAGRTSASTASYSFRLLDLDGAADIAYDTEVSGDLDPGRTTVIHRFDGTAGDALYFDYLSTTSSNARWSLVDPSGHYVFNPNYLTSDIGRTVLTQTGSYALIVEGRVNQTDPISYDFVVRHIVDQNGTLVLGDTTSGTLATQDQRDTYTVTIDSPSLLYFDSLTNSGGIRWNLAGQPGTLDERTFSASDSTGRGDAAILAVPAGTYTLAVFSTNGTTGDYAFRLVDLADAPALTFGSPVEGTLAGGNSTDLFRFDGTAGEQIVLNMDFDWRVGPLEDH